MDFKFKVTHKDKISKARAGTFETPHGIIETPTFVPVGTQASIKSLTPQDLKDIGVQFFFGNTYHLHLRPGEDVVNEFGGLARFMGWDGATITDSGGFQVFSLGARKAISRSGRAVARVGGNSNGSSDFQGIPKQVRNDNREEEEEQLIKILQEDAIETFVKITDDGVEFKSHIDGSTHFFSPEVSIQVQKKLGADIILSFDECPPYPATHEMAERANRRTHEWAKRGLEEFKNGKKYFDQGLVGIVQGSTFQDLREESAKFISTLDFDAFAIGGVAVGENKKDMRNAIKWSVPHLPENKFRHLLGIGEVDDIFDAVELGCDTMDCVIPSRLGRSGFVFVHPPEGNLANRFRIQMLKSVYLRSSDPLDPFCDCYVCKTFTRGYLHHLFRAKELLAYRLATYHNEYSSIHLMKEIRKAILDGSFQKMKKEWLNY